MIDIPIAPEDKGYLWRIYDYPAVRTLKLIIISNVWWLRALYHCIETAAVVISLAKNDMNVFDYIVTEHFVHDDRRPNLHQRKAAWTLLPDVCARYVIRYPLDFLFTLPESIFSFNKIVSSISFPLAAICMFKFFFLSSLVHTAWCLFCWHLTKI